MAKYKYKALQDNTKIVEGEIEAENLREAREFIRNLGYLPTKIYSENQSENICKKNKTNFFDKNISKLSLTQKIMFTSQLELFLSAGIPILSALENIQNNINDIKLEILCKNLEKAIKSGYTFAQALENFYSHIFDDVYLGLVKTGENSGELDKALGRLLLLLKKQESIKNKIISASIYPSILIVMLLGLLILFAKYVFPKFAMMMAFNGAELPQFAQAIMGTFTFVGNFWWLILFGAFGGIYAVIKLLKNPLMKKYWDNYVLKIPVVSDFITYINLSNFMTVMNISYEAGIPIMSGLELASKTVGNFVIKSKVFQAVSYVKNGKTLTEAFDRTNVIPSALLSMISTGEQAGGLGKMFRECAEVIDKKVDMALEAMTRLFEPAVILLIGGFVLFVAVALMQAYASLLGSFI